LLSNELHLLYESAPIILSKPIGEELMKQFSQIIMQTFHGLATHKELKKFINEDFKRGVMSLFMFHGERERFIRQWPSSSNEPSDVLTITRPSDHLRAIGIQNLNLSDILRDCHIYEKETIFIIKCMTYRWFSYSGNSKSKLINECFVIEQLVSLDDIEKYIIGTITNLPVLLCFVQIYYVLYKKHIYRTLQFLEAFMIWLSILTNKEKVLAPKQLLENIGPYLEYFEICDI
jgi:hypothetical protein